MANSGPWDKYTAQQTSEGPWTKYSPSVSDSSEEEPSELESGLRGAAQGASFNFAPAIAGAVEAVPQGLLNIASGSGSLKDLMAAYTKARDASQAQFKAAEKANPKSYMGGQLVGSIAPAILTPELEGLSGLEAGAQVGGAGGALSGLGQSVSEGQDLGDTAKNVAAQGLMGAGIGGILGKGKDLLSPSNLEESAALRAVKASGANKSQMKNLMNAPTNDPNSESRLIEQGQNLLKNKVVTPLATPEDILERSQDLAQTSGSAIGDALNQLDSKYSVEDPSIKKFFFNPQDAADQVQELQQQFVKNGQVVPLYKAEYGQLQDALDTINQYGNKPVDFSVADQLKQLISKTAYNDQGKLQDQLMGQVRGIVNDGIEDAADKVTQAVNDPDLFNKYLQAKDTYRTAKDAINSATGKVAGNLTNRDLGITDYMAGIPAAVRHGVPGAIVAAGANNIIKKYGNSLAATGYQRTADTISSLGKAFNSVPKPDIKSMGDSLIASGDLLSNKLGHVLVNAADKDDIGRNALIFTLLQNPGYRELMQHLVTKPEDK